MSSKFGTKSIVLQPLASNGRVKARAQRTKLGEGEKVDAIEYCILQHAPNHAHLVVVMVYLETHMIETDKTYRDGILLNRQGPLQPTHCLVESIFLPSPKAFAIYLDLSSSIGHINLHH